MGLFSFPRFTFSGAERTSRTEVSGASHILFPRGGSKTIVQAEGKSSLNECSMVARACFGAECMMSTGRDCNTATSVCYRRRLHVFLKGFCCCK